MCASCVQVGLRSRNLQASRIHRPPPLTMTSGPPLRHPLFLQGTPETRASSGTSLAEMERAHILAVIEECGWKLSGKGNAADRLGLKRSTLQFRMAKHGIHRPVHGA